MTRHVYSRGRTAALLVAALGISSALWAGQDIGAPHDAAPLGRRPLSEAQLLERIRQLDPELQGDLTPLAIGCEIQDAFGSPVTTISVSDFGDQSYWLHYQSDGGFDRTVTFFVLPDFEDSPLQGQGQRFTPNDACSITTPFGIPSWGLDRTSGPWMLVVRNNRGGVARCPFEVVP